MSVKGLSKLDRLNALRQENSEFKRRLASLKKEGTQALKSQRKANSEQLNRVTAQGESQQLDLQRSVDKRLSDMQQNHHERIIFSKERMKESEQNLQDQLNARLEKIKLAKEESLRHKQVNTDKMTGQVERLQKMKNEQILNLKRKQDSAIQNSNKRWAVTYQDLQKDMGDKFDKIKHQGELSLINMRAASHKTLEAQKQLGDQKLQEIRKRQHKREGEILEGMKNADYNASSRTISAQSKLENRLQEQQQSADKAYYKTRGLTEKAIIEMKNASDIELNELKTRLKYKRLAEASTTNRANVDRTAHEMKQLKNREMQFQKKLAEMGHLQRHALKRVNSIYKRNLDHINKTQKDSLKMAQKNFHQRILTAKKDGETSIKNREGAHQQTLKNIDNKLNEQKQMLFENMAKNFALIQRAEDNEFYQIKKLDSSLNETDKAYEVKIKLPEYEKRNLNIQIGKKNVRLTLARSFKGNYEDPEGTETYATYNNQSISKNIPLKAEVDAKGFQKNWSDGIMTITVPKAT